MKSKHRLFGIIAFSALLCSGGHAQQLTADQQKELLKVGKEFKEKGRQLEAAMVNKLDELVLELKREGRLDSEAAAKATSARVDKLLKEVSALYGGLVQNKVDHFLKTKNALTDEQRKHLVGKLSPQELMPLELVMIIEPNVFDLPLNLSREQKKDVIRLNAELMIKNIELERDAELLLIDLEAFLLAGTPRPDQFDPLAKKLGEIAVRELDNRINFVIQAKEVLTLHQRRLLLYLLELE